MIGCSTENEKKIIRENAFEQKKEKLGLKFTTGLALISFRTAGPRLLSKA